jgi:hypothetical protein
MHVCKIGVGHTRTKVCSQRRVILLKRDLTCRHGKFGPPELRPSRDSWYPSFLHEIKAGIRLQPEELRVQ